MLVDYVMMALLMQDSGTIFYCLFNVSVYFVIVALIRNSNKNIPEQEFSISFTVSLSMLNQLGNIWYYTTSLNRVLFLFDGLQIHDRDPAFYYLGFGLVFTLIAIARIFLNEYLSWNQEARIQVSTYDDDEDAPIDCGLDDDEGGVTELAAKMVDEEPEEDEAYD